MTEKSSKVVLKKCEICSREQEWCTDGYVITKGWHGVEQKRYGWGKTLYLRYPPNHSEKVVCAECVPKTVLEYLKIESYK